MIEWYFNNVCFKFGYCKLNQNNDRNFTGFGLIIITGQEISAAEFKDNIMHGEGRCYFANG
jgi:hypothetical protein